MIEETLFQGTVLVRVIGGACGGWGRAIGRVNMVENHIAYLGLRRGRENSKSNIHEQKLGPFSGVKIRQSEYVTDYIFG